MTLYTPKNAPRWIFNKFGEVDSDTGEKLSSFVQKWRKFAESITSAVAQSLPGWQGKGAVILQSPGLWKSAGRLGRRGAGSEHGNTAAVYSSIFLNPRTEVTESWAWFRHAATCCVIGWPCFIYYQVPKETQLLLQATENKYSPCHRRTLFEQKKLLCELKCKILKMQLLT